MKDGSVIEGKIVRGDESSVYVKPAKKCPRKIKELNPGKICYHPEESIERNTIKDIDHPGDVAAAIGTTLALTGTVCFLTTYSDAKQCSGDDCWGKGYAMLFIGIPCACVAVVGTLTGIGGWINWLSSKSAATPQISPVALTDGEQTYYGVGLRWSW